MNEGTGDARELARRTPLLIAGPTAAGKSEVALVLAERIGGEIISVDSMQVYRGLDLGTAKPSAEQRARVPHHLIDIVGLTDTFDAAKFLEQARRAVTDIQSRGRVPILCGGTGLYFKAYLEGLGKAPPANAQLRAELEAMPLPDLVRELAERDPVAHEKMDRENRRRVIRALEVIRLTGKPFSAQRAGWERHSGRSSGGLGFGLSRSNADLRQRIDARVDDMFRNGLVPETERLLDQGLAENRTALQALGYRQVTEYLRGQRSLEQTIELVKIRTRQFAKRQMTWFKRQLSLDWIELACDQAAVAAVDRLMEMIGRPKP